MVVTQLTALPNPYDFANPVTEKQLFVGRDKEQGEVKYYLDQAKLAARPINLALIGERASGKTSFLNIIEVEAKTRNLLPVRIDLDEGDATSQLSFFYKIFNAVFTALTEAGKLGGISGKTYEAYLDMVSSYTVADDNRFLPFLFPVQYAKAKSAGNENLIVDDQLYKRDLTKLHKEAGSAIVLLFDECNVLKSGRMILEKLRNIFMNTPGYMLVFSGTKDLFPVMDDVFSPIIRQFKKIEIGAFTRMADTMRCVTQPVLWLNLPQRTTASLFNREVVAEIHVLSGGRPYEVQLICHMLFKRCQEGRAKRFILNLNVLDEIRQELASGHDLKDRQILLSARSFPKQTFRALNVLCPCREKVPFEFLWNAEYVTHGYARWTKDNLEEQKGLLLAEKIIRETSSHIEFLGDQFDRIYLKYMARQKGINLQQWDTQSEVFVWREFERVLKKWQSLEMFDLLNTGERTDDLKNVHRELTAGSNFDDLMSRSPLEETLFELLMEAKDEGKPWTFFQCRLVTPLFNVQFWLRWSEDTNTEKFGRLEREWEEIRSRAQEVGWMLDIEKITFPGANRMALVERVRSSGNDVVRARMASWFGGRIIECYIGEKDKNEAYFAGDMMLRLNEDLSPDDANNYGYLALTRDDLETAEKLFDNVLKSNKPYDSRALTSLNMAITKFRKDVKTECRDYLKRACVEQRAEESAGCVFAIEDVGGALGIVEKFEVSSVREIAEKALQVLDERFPAEL